MLRLHGLMVRDRGASDNLWEEGLSRASSENWRERG